jgi:adenylate cyclase
MFCDIRDFTQICDRLPDDAVYQLLSQIMDLLTDCIREEMGVVIDYFGDGVAAFWNAPFDQPDHAELACQAANNMLNALTTLNLEWEPMLGHPIKIGIGIHSGEALVGNSGSRFRIKYGPRGQTVNLAKRIESATKHFGVPILVGEETARGLDQAFRSRRVSRVLLPGSSQIVSLYEPIAAKEYAERQFEFAAYENALDLFEASNFVGCCAMLEPLLDEGSPHDPIALTLYRQAVCRRDGNFDRRRNDDSLTFTPLPKTAETPA